MAETFRRQVDNLNNVSLNNWLSTKQYVETSNQTKEKNTQSLLETNSVAVQIIDESLINELNPISGRAEWLEIVDKLGDESLYTVTEIKEGNLSSVDNTLLKVLIIEGDGEHPLELKFPELRDIQEEYGLLQKTHAIRTSNGWSKVQ